MDAPGRVAGHCPRKFYEWRDRYGTVHEHNAWIPRDHWLLPEEEQAILDFHTQHPLEGYRLRQRNLWVNCGSGRAPREWYRESSTVL